MRAERKFGIKGFLHLILLLIPFILLFLAWADDLSANSRENPSAARPCFASKTATPKAHIPTQAVGLLTNMRQLRPIYRPWGDLRHFYSGSF